MKQGLPLIRKLLSVQCLGSFNSVIWLLYIKKKKDDFLIPKTVKEKVCVVLMLRRNTKCITFAMQFILNNSALQK